ncbi:flavin-containing monooxygenase [Desertimonas flava]|uniref:flavin-containing monooxygenase n=1 Tax=Desertimonas flava TaxID=2064846 RepID=UPI0013C52E99|nr:NAD(P)/FAD-dependent oxidoreductase [Desertimonas flava]
MDVAEVDLESAIAAADPIALRAALWIQTRSPALAAMPSHRPGAMTSHVVPPLELREPSDVERVRAEALVVMRALQAGDLTPRTPTAADVPTIVELLTGDRVAEETHEFWWEELAAVEQSRRPDPIDEAALRRTFPDLHVVIIGSGMGGISAAVMLQAVGIPFTILEKNADVGGTWFSNTYPGVRVDLPSRAYSYTFEPDHLWRHYFAPQDELLEYLQHAVDRRGLREHIEFETEVSALRWDADIQTWHITVRRADGSTTTIDANFVVSAVGLFSRPRQTDIDGLGTFRGTAMHTSEWDHSVDIKGRRVGVVGTGSSGVQVVRELADAASRLTVFQRSANWISQLANYTSPIPDDELWMLANFPYYVNCVRIMQVHSIGDTDARVGFNDVDPDWDDPHSVSKTNAALRESMVRYIEEQLAGRPDLIEKVTPVYPPMARRVPKDNGWYAALREDHVDLETRPIRRVVSDGVELEGGDVVELDVLVLATGFRTTEYLWPMTVTGVDGVDLSEAWSTDGPRAYLGIMVPRFPNLFCLYGPNTNPISGGPCMWGELQARFAAEAIGALARAGRRSIDVRREVFEAYNELLDENLATKVWLDSRQTSYFVNDHGRVVTNAPWQTRQYWRWTRRPELDDYHLSGGADEGQ